MKTLKVLLVLGLFLGATLADAQQAPLIKADELAKMLSQPDVVVVSARKPEDYKAVHINGAVNIYYKELIQKGDYDQMKSPEDLAVLFGSKGITENSVVVIYDDGTQKGASFTYWILKYLGAKKIYLLDGGIDAWKAARKPVTSQPTKISPAVFTIHLSQDVICSKEYFMANYNKPGIGLLDARESEQFSGEKGPTTRKGHIPGSVNIIFSDMVAKGAFLTKEEIITHATNAGLKPDQEMLIYCNSGIKAAVVYFAFVDIAGFNNVKIYVGSFNEWESNPANAVVK